jgi:hypothetical protein
MVSGKSGDKMKCIVCSKKTGNMYFLGSKKEMSVAFCKEHVNDCMECDKCNFNVVLRTTKSY